MANELFCLKVVTRTGRCAGKVKFPGVVGNFNKVVKKVKDYADLNHEVAVVPYSEEEDWDRGFADYYKRV